MGKARHLRASPPAFPAGPLHTGLLRYYLPLRTPAGTLTARHITPPPPAGAVIALGSVPRRADVTTFCIPPATCLHLALPACYLLAPAPTTLYQTGSVYARLLPAFGTRAHASPPPPQRCSLDCSTLLDGWAGRMVAGRVANRTGPGHTPPAFRAAARDACGWAATGTCSSPSDVVGQLPDLGEAGGRDRLAARVRSTTTQFTCSLPPRRDDRQPVRHATTNQ